jgi:predicted enzyme related to lactoylglutathione lyase
MHLKHLRLISIPVSDQVRSKAFYIGTLGLELITEEDMHSGLRWVEVGLPGSETSISLVTWLESMVPGSTRGVILLTEDIEADQQELAAKGVEFLGPIEQQHWGRFVQFKDPDGNVLVLQENLKGS